MSDWINEKHRAARVLVNTAPREFVDDLARTNALHQALDEIERLRADRDRWIRMVEDEGRTHEQTRLALIDMTERATHPEITDDRVERAAIQMCATERHADVWATLTESERDDFRADARAALNAAFTPRSLR